MGSLLKGQKRPVQGQAEARRCSDISHMCGRDPSGPSSSAFPRLLAGSLIRSRGAGTHIGANMGCQHDRHTLNLLYQTLAPMMES